MMSSSKKQAPLADQLRPKTLEDVIGQDHLLGDDGILKNMLDHQALSSLILWGPPGTGKTTIARILAHYAQLHFVQISAIFSGVNDLKKAFDEAKKYHQHLGKSTLLFVDEIHRFNRAQQDGFLPVVEDGTIILIGATTENPSFTLNSALLSRCQVLVLRRLEDTALSQLLYRAEQQLGKKLPLSDKARQDLISMADGDGRYLLNMIEQITLHAKSNLLESKDLAKILSRRASLYDRNRDEHYNLISALHKSLRGSDPDAALYWFARMLEGGEDPRYIARRLTRFAAEDIGLASPNALTLAVAGWETFERLGSPEGEVALAEVVVYLATAPKSNAVYKAYNKVREVAKKTGSFMPPAHILNAPTSMMKDLGYGQGYEYDHDTEEGFSGQNYFPDQMRREQFYFPTQRGMEETIHQRIAHWNKIRKKRSV
ncbi:replication-associated recombination protein A [Commensalibacter oyaizuii]|uniref:Replication-associated recombination protein A n=1 Tax=Commensalibacter oyaizuii TaxID=3043873 RepID=A0ABT6PZJ0_9PROT|nr:replication-associated recombination protein A [Commensalibacter sp. TBRC 16381]MDI2090276.1 replication-associated recombination protein A [Commensalibacter sp. TBRC 16381]